MTDLLIILQRTQTVLYPVSVQYFHFFVCPDSDIWRGRNEVQLWTGLDWQKVACNFLCLVLRSALVIFYSQSTYLLPFMSNWNCCLVVFFNSSAFIKKILGITNFFHLLQILNILEVKMHLIFMCYFLGKHSACQIQQI